MSDPKALAHEFADSLNARSIERLLAILHPDYAQHNRYVEPGKRGVGKFFSGFLDALSDVRVEAFNVISEGDLVAGRYTYDGTHTGPFLGAAPTGKSVRMKSIDIWRVQDGLLIEHWDEINTFELMGQLGLIPPSAQGQPSGNEG